MSESITAQETVITAMVTPFHDDGRLNHEGAQELAAYLVNHGSDGLVLAGTTGESPTLSTADQLDLFDIVRQAVGQEVLLLGGTGSNSTREAMEMTRVADSRGSVNGILAVSPYYNRPSQFGIDHYYRSLAGVTDLPITLYNIPVRTGRLVELDTISQLVEDRAITGVKDATGNTDMAAALHRRFGSDVTIYSGDDGLNLKFARAGAVGAISVASHWSGELMGRMFEAHFSGDETTAKRIEAALEPSCRFESSHTDESGNEHDTPNPIPTKVMMAGILGDRVVGNCMPPMIAPEQEMEYLRTRAAEILTDLEAVASRTISA